MLLSFALLGGGAALALKLAWSRWDRNPTVCDLRRCIVVVGDDQNHPDCIAQRRALKPILMMIRAAQINVVEVYGNDLPRRNGQTLEWTSNKMLRRTLLAERDFHFMCIDDQADIAMRVRLPVSEGVVRELIDGEARHALPAPGYVAPTADEAADETVSSNESSASAPSPEQDAANIPPSADGWTSSVGVLR